MKYRNEEDKCYGITGMAIGITIWNGEDMLYKLDLDNESSQYVQFTSDYYFSGNPGIPAKEGSSSNLVVISFLFRRFSSSSFLIL